MFKTFATEAEYTAALTAEFERGAASVSTTSPAEIEKIKAESFAAGATAERERIQSVEAQALPGHAKLINELKFDGKTTGHEAAVAVLNAERTLRGTKGKDLEYDAAVAVDASAPDAAREAAEKKKQEAAAAEVDPLAEAAKLQSYVAEQAKAGRKVSLAQASAEINKK
jgi:hypothetical protein